MIEIDVEGEKKEIQKRYRALLKACKPTMEKGDKRLIRQAFELSVDAHKNMRRKSGEPYIYHPIAVAQIAAEEIGLGTTSIVCALLHDVVEDTELSLEDIEREFGKKVANIIDGLTKIAGVFDQTSSIQAENFRKMLLTLADDVRVILIKLADRLHNMRTLESMPRDKQLKISSETAYLYAPLAHRLGLYSIKSELEDLSMKFTEASTYKLIAQKLNETKIERNKFINEFIKPIEEKKSKKKDSNKVKKEKIVKHDNIEISNDNKEDIIEVKYPEIIADINDIDILEINNKNYFIDKKNNIYQITDDQDIGIFLGIYDKTDNKIIYMK
jgi:GTP pyrophosphokinase